MPDRNKVNGMCVDLTGGRKVAVYDFTKHKNAPAYGLFFVSKDGDETRVGLSVEAIKALKAILNKMDVGQAPIGMWFDAATGQWSAAIGKLDAEREGK